MATLVSAADLGTAWVRTLRSAMDHDGHAVNLVTTVETPTLDENPALRAVLDARLPKERGGKPRLQSVDTVASTIFPDGLYRAPAGAWTPGNDAPFDAAAASLYDAYRQMYPALRRVHSANKKGTYFGRLVAWELAGGGALNQLDLRVQHLRRKHEQGVQQWNINELVLSGEQEVVRVPDDLQIYRPTDHRGLMDRGFPCLSHVDVTVYRSRLHLTGVYRHQLLLTKGYGNLLGLARLQQFMAQQTGYHVGELCMVGTFSDAECGGERWTKTEARAILDESEAVLS